MEWRIGPFLFGLDIDNFVLHFDKICFSQIYRDLNVEALEAARFGKFVSQGFGVAMSFRIMVVRIPV